MLLRFYFHNVLRQLDERRIHAIHIQRDIYNEKYVECDPEFSEKAMKLIAERAAVLYSGGDFGMFFSEVLQKAVFLQ